MSLKNVTHQTKSNSSVYSALVLYEIKGHLNIIMKYQKKERNIEFQQPEWYDDFLFHNNSILNIIQK